MIQQSVPYSVGDRSFAGTSYAPDDASRRPGVLVLHEGTGVGPHLEERAGMIASLGYVAYAPDLFGEKFTSREHGMTIIGTLVKQRHLLRARLAAALDVLRSSPGVDARRLAVIGFCFGGLAALEVARSGADVRAAVSFHGGLQAEPPAARGDIRCPVLVCTGAEDPFVTRDHRAAFEDEMRAAEADWEMLVLGGAQHAFTNRRIDPAVRPGCAYNQAADERSWAAMRALFASVF
ncbi:MAG TPA: dienelactone hydrolase family protein [Bauldia sp.]|nr:dienelactone hydrolase family protein [Bauldia sp.]